MIGLPARVREDPGWFYLHKRMTIEIPEYLLRSILRHYAALASSPPGRPDLRAMNARRVARTEINRAERLVAKQKNNV